MLFRRFRSGAAAVRAAVVLPVLLAVALLGPLRTIRAQPLGDIDRGRARNMLNGIKGAIQKTYYDPAFRGIDIEAHFKLAGEKLERATSLGQAMGIIAQALLDFDDSHTYFIPPPRTATVEYGWQSKMIGDRCYVTAVRPGTDAEAKGLKPGDLLVSVQGLTPARANLWKLNYLLYSLRPVTVIRVVVQSPGGQSRQLEIASKIHEGKRVVDLTGASESDVDDLIRQVEGASSHHRFQTSGGILIWNMPAFEMEPDELDRVAGDRLGGATSLILDLRGNPGGYVVSLERFVSRFFDREVKIAELEGRRDMKPMLARKRRGTPFAGQVVVLVDSRTTSAAELFARVMQLEKRGIVVGDRSNGAVMQSEVFNGKMGAGTMVFYGASISNADVIMSDGRSLERVGVVPDEVVLPTAEDMAAGRDPVLARAAAIVGAKLDPVEAGKMFPVEWK